MARLAWTMNTCIVRMRLRMALRSMMIDISWIDSKVRIATTHQTSFWNFWSNQWWAYFLQCLKTFGNNLLPLVDMDIVQWGSLARTLSQPEGMKCGMCMSLASPQVTSCCLILAGYEDGTLALWDAAQQKSPLTICKPHAEPAMALAVHENGVPPLSPNTHSSHPNLPPNSPYYLQTKPIQISIYTCGRQFLQMAPCSCDIISPLLPHDMPGHLSKTV